MITLSTLIPLLRLLTLFKQLWSKNAFMFIHNDFWASEQNVGVDG